MKRKITPFQIEIRKEPQLFLKNPKKRLKVYKEWAQGVGLFGKVYEKHARIYDIYSQAQDANNTVWKTINSFIKKKPNILIDLPGGTGKYLPEMAGISKKVYFIEPEKNEIQIAKEHLNKTVEGKNKVTFFAKRLGEAKPKQKADVMVCNYGLWNISQKSENIPKTLEEMKKLVKPGGQIIIEDVWDFKGSNGRFNQMMRAAINEMKKIGKVKVKIIKNTPQRFNSVLEKAFIQGTVESFIQNKKYQGIRNMLKYFRTKKESNDVCVINIELPKA